MNHCVLHKLISNAQHGFVSHKACVTNLLEALDIMTEAMNNGYPVDIIFTDFDKAFDKVPHKRLLHQLRSYGIRNELILWIKNWLTGRKQKAGIGEHISEWKNVTSGVPQGSVLRPLLFVLYINDLPENTHHTDKLYADDSIIIGIIKSHEDAEKLQGDIKKVVEWSNK